jgi:hypothetical protein
MIELLRTQPAETIVDEYVFGDEVFALRATPDALDALRQHLSQELEVSVEDVAIVGSARSGYSLAPDTFPRAFSSHSDIDVIVVNEPLFDYVWGALLTWNYRQRWPRWNPDRSWAQERQADIYWGWLTPNRIRYEGLRFPRSLIPLRDFSTRWFTAFQTLSQAHQVFLGRDVEGRLYRSWDLARRYHSHGIRKLVRRLTSSEA